MKGKVSSIFWGILFILGGMVLLADRLGWVDFSQFSSNTWVYVFVAAGVVFLLGYFLSGFKSWGLLFPALILAAIGVTLWMSDQGMTGSFLGMPILIAIAIPFFVGFLLDRKAWPLLIPAWVMTVVAFVTLFAESANGTLVGAMVQYAIATPFLVVFLLNRKHWWALIPAWAMFLFGTVTLLSEHVNGNLIGALVLYGIALPFLVVYLNNRSFRWALIPAAALGFVGTIPLLDTVVGGDWMGVAVMLLFAAVFLFVYFRWNFNWWAIIPGGIFLSIAVTVFLGILLPENNPIVEGILTGVLLLGFGLTFGALWLLREKHTTAWARYPAIGLLVAAVLAFIFGSNSNLFWAIALLAAGAVLVVYSLLQRKPQI
jgi:hypothetical protein